MENITIKTTINAPIEKVWQYFTEAKYIMQWNNASPDWHTPAATNDLIVGGKFSYTMAAKDGSFSFDFEGIYDDIQENKYIAYTIADGRKVEIIFEANGDTVEITETFEAENQNPIEMQRGGWQAILDNFKKLVESGN
ncbi:SRPBCC family protein [Pedobacter sp. SL55]|uniref:SRPBCC family protein n=1 Tax=Pedobacter sp. SL55 TaxID=2995161 RepID=UPI00226F4B5F|nr:SRPBCC family protein [Pedobacter sp. SL55]WAC40672.1 SRPBCC family protein [Pedobacter sp. SL55]